MDVLVDSASGHKGNMSTNLCRTVVVWQREARPSPMAMGGKAISNDEVQMLREA